MTGLVRAMVFTLLRDEPEYNALSSPDSERVLTDAVQRVEQDQRRGGASLTAIVARYIADVTDSDRCAPGIWQRYVDTLRASDRIPTPAAAVDDLGETTTYDELIDFATDSTRFDGDIVDLF